jgi:hypothetical protein
MIFVAFIVLELELSGREPDLRKSCSGLAVVGRATRVLRGYGVLLLLEYQIIDHVSNFSGKTAKEAMGDVGLGLDCAKNQLGDGVVRRHGRLSWPCLSEECGIWDFGMFVCAKARERRREKKMCSPARSSPFACDVESQKGTAPDGRSEVRNAEGSGTWKGRCEYMMKISMVQFRTVASVSLKLS